MDVVVRASNKPSPKQEVKVLSDEGIKAPKYSEIDYRELLKAYMAVVIDVEGISFVERTGHCVELSKTATAHLLALEEEVREAHGF